MSTSAQLDGFDVSEDQFPDKGWLPKNVTLSTLDSLAPLPDHLVGKYDVVHIGLVVMIISNENPVPLLKNVMAMLSTLLSVLDCAYTAWLTFWNRAGWLHSVG